MHQKTDNNKPGMQAGFALMRYALIRHTVIAAIILLVQASCTTLTTSALVPATSSPEDCRIIQEQIRPAFLWGALPLNSPNLRPASREGSAYRLENRYIFVDLFLSLAGGFVLSYHQSRIATIRCKVDGSFLTASQMESKVQEGREAERKARARTMAEHVRSLWQQAYPDRPLEKDAEDWWTPERQEADSANESASRSSNNTGSASPANPAAATPGSDPASPPSSGPDNGNRRDEFMWRLVLSDGPVAEGRIVRFNEEKLIPEMESSNQREILLADVISVSPPISRRD